LGSSPTISTPPAKKQKTSDSPRGDKTSRSSPVRDLAQQRDNSRCVLSGDRTTEIAHIYPFHSIKHKEEDILGQWHTFWDLLGVFWPKEKIAAWEAELFPKGIHETGREEVYNLITLSRTAYDQWGRGAFALKLVSVSDDKMTLEVQFFWQKKQKDTQTTMSLLTTPFSTEGLDRNVGAYGHDTDDEVKLFNYRTNQLIKSGDYFKLQTNDPITKPLPSFQLLEMQWFLQRVQGMAGAADIDWPPYSDEDSDEEIPDLNLDEVGDSSLESVGLPPTPEFLRKDVHLPNCSKHHTEEAEGDGKGVREGVRDGDRAQVSM
jgi:hypothetical protein